MDENKFWLSLWLGIGFLVVVFCTTLIILSYRYDYKMAELGYQETSILGNAYPVWQKNK
jgi:hypothetical protein